MPSYTSEPLTADTEVTGNPVVALFVATDKPEADFCVYLEEISSTGDANYVTEGELRASRRKLARAPYVNPGPFHSDDRKDHLSVPAGKPYKLDITLLPMSHVFRKGTRIRLVLAPADSRQFRDRTIEPVSWTIYGTRARPSQIALPTAE